MMTITSLCSGSNGSNRKISFYSSHTKHRCRRGGCKFASFFYLLLLLVVTMFHHPYSGGGVLSLSPPFQLQHLDHIVLNCQDLNSMLEFYTDTLGCTTAATTTVNDTNGTVAHLRAGPTTRIDLMTTEVVEPTTILDNPTDDCRAVPGSWKNHFCLRIHPYDQEALEDYFHRKGVLILQRKQQQSKGRTTKKGVQGIEPSLCIQDPEGNRIELKGGEAKMNYETTIIKKKDIPAHGNNNDGETITTTIDKQDRVPLTPCTRICRYNADFFDGQVCIGCYREAYEIGTWASMSPSEKHMGLLDAIDRLEGNLFATSSLALDGAITLDELRRQADYWKSVSSSQD